MGKKSLSRWCAEAKLLMFKRGITVTALAKEVGMSRPYLSNVLNCNVKSKKGVEAVSEYLGIVPPHSCDIGGE